jgi:acetylornithine deacetylase/succinyl-diaminopimelate desuccinylase-like protein
VSELHWTEWSKRPAQVEHFQFFIIHLPGKYERKPDSSQSQPAPGSATPKSRMAANPHTGPPPDYPPSILSLPASCYPETVTMALFNHNSAFSRVTALASRRPVHAAFAWLHGNPKTIMDWQAQMVAIPAPPFGEAARSRWLAARFAEIGLASIETDEAGNVIGLLPAAHLPPGSAGPVVVLSAHLDTVFPAETPLHPVVNGDRLEAPGACDNGAGVAGMLAIAQALVQARVQAPVPLLFLGNVGEEGEGDLRGVRHFYQQSTWAARVAAHIVLDGAGAESAVTQALGSCRYRITITGPGGHSFTDAGTPNPITALASALAILAQTELPEEPRTTLNIGTIHGGTSVNSIPESATAAIDFRSTSSEQLMRLETGLRSAVDDAVTHWNGQVKPDAQHLRGQLDFELVKIGDRPAANLAAESPLIEALRAVDRHLGVRTDLLLGSTDANIPLSLGVPALSMGAGGAGGGAHTQAEWYSAHDREAGLKRVLLLTLAMTEWAAGQ